MQATLIDIGNGLPPKGSIVLVPEPQDQARFEIAEVESEGFPRYRNGRYESINSVLRIRYDIHPADIENRDVDPFDCDVIQQDGSC